MHTARLIGLVLSTLIGGLGHLATLATVVLVFIPDPAPATLSLPLPTTCPTNQAPGAWDSTRHAGRS